MEHLLAIGFDLFNTLITMELSVLDDANSRLIHCLHENDLPVEVEPFKLAYRQSAQEHMEKTRRDGRETHNRFWISAALSAHGYPVPPDDARIAKAVDAYFSAFLDFCRLIPGTREMLTTLKREYRLGLLSNFTHAPAAREIMQRVDITPFFDVVLISDELGYRKPHPVVFSKLLEGLGVEGHCVLYVGDDPDADIAGARKAGVHPVWTTHVQDRLEPSGQSRNSGEPERVDESVPRISDWEDLYTILRASRET